MILLNKFHQNFDRHFCFRLSFFLSPPPKLLVQCNSVQCILFQKVKRCVYFSFQFSTTVITITIAAINIIFNITLPFAANASFDLHQVWCQLTFAAKTETCCATSHNCICSWFTCMVLFVMSAVSLFLEYKHLLNWITERERDNIRKLIRCYWFCNSVLPPKITIEPLSCFVLLFVCYFYDGCFMCLIMIVGSYVIVMRSHVVIILIGFMLISIYISW